MNIKYYLNDYYDISEYMLELPELHESCEEAISTTNEIVFTVKNKDDWCNVRNTNSPFFGNPLSHFYIVAKDIGFNNRQLIKGIITKVKPYDNGKAEITIKNSFVELEQEIKQSYYRKTLKELFSILSKDYNITVDLASITPMPENGLLYSLRVNEDEQLKICDLISTIAESLGVFIFLSNSTIYLKPYNMINSGSYYTVIDDNDILDYTKDKNYDNIINQYSIRYYLNQETPIGDVNNVGYNSRQKYGEKPTKEIDASQQSNFVIMEKNGAIQSGENYINRFKECITILDISFPEQRGYYWFLELGEWYIIEDNLYQLITKTLNISGSKVQCTFWGLN